MTSPTLNGKPAIGVLVSASPVTNLSAQPRTPLSAVIPPTVASPVAASPARRFMSSYWPVFAGAGAALILVSAGLALAIGYLEKTGDESTVAAVEPKPATTSTPLVPVMPAPATATPQPTKSNTPSPQMPPAAIPAKVAVPIKDDVSPQLKLPEAPPIDIGIEIAMDTGKGIAKGLLEEPPGALPRCETYGTAINFVRSPLLAAKHAQVEDKLVFTLHVSGNFEDPGFT